jgi:hypothetical protein
MPSLWFNSEVLFYSARNEESGMCRNNSEKLNNSQEVESETVKSSPALLQELTENYICHIGWRRTKQSG